MNLDSSIPDAYCFSVTPMLATFRSVDQLAGEVF
jgi:hypothetical protein